MASAISYEYLQSQKAANDGIATLDGTGKIPVGQLPDVAIETFKGIFATDTELTTDYPTGTTGDYAYVEDTSSYWYWNNALTTPAWVNQEITAVNYNSLSAEAKAAVPYIIV